MNPVAALPRAQRCQVLFLRKVVADLMGDLPTGFDRIEGWHGDWQGAGVDAVVIGGRERLAGALLDLFPELRLIACVGAGFDGVDLDAARARGVEVVNATGSNAGDVADFAVALTLSAVCRLPALHRMVVDGSWEGGAGAPVRRSLSDLTIDILGMGRIGRAVADRLIPFGCRLIWWGPRARPDEPLPRADDVMALAEQADVVIVCCRADDSNRNLVNAEFFAARGSCGVLVNVARGSIVHQFALLDALRGGRIGGAALDVFAVEPTSATDWAGLETVVLAPHAGGLAQGAIERQRAVLHDNLDRFRASLPLLRRLI